MMEKDDFPDGRTQLGRYGEEMGQEGIGEVSCPAF